MALVTTQENLKREIGVRSLTLVILNITAGSGIFVIPAIIAEGLGATAILAYFVCGVLIFLIGLCFAEVGSKTTGHAEAVMVFYDPKMVSYATLLNVYFASQDPTQVNGQGPDRGSPYRSIIFYRNESEQKAAEAAKKALGDSGKYTAPIAAEILPFKAFYNAEDYHQNYERMHPDNPYVQHVSIPRLRKFEAQLPDLLKKGDH